MGEGIDLERKIAYWWPRQEFKVVHGEGLFTHKDIYKYGK
jgi:isopentenyl phosphate kinase